MEMDDLLIELMPIYLGELHEHVRMVGQELLALENENDESKRSVLLETLFRSIHSLKGASRSVGLSTMASVCHEVESILAAGQEGAALSPQDYQLMFKTLDAMSAMAQLLQTDDTNAERQLAPLLFSLKDRRAKIVPASNDIETPPRHIDDIHPSLAKVEHTGSRVLEKSVRLPVTKLDHLLAESSVLMTVANGNVSCLQNVNQLQEKVIRWHREAKHERQQPNEELERLKALTKDLEHIRAILENENRHLSAAVSSVTTGINGLRMVPIGQACQGIDRIVRDLAVSGNKQIQLVYRGMDIEVDRNVLEQLKDPLMHLVRNACDHGIEPASERIQAGKGPQAVLTVEASLIGNQVQIVVSDDGRGISIEAVSARAKRLSLPKPESESEMKHLLFTRGFSTSPFITEVSGRGVGLDVVKENIERLHGSVDFETQVYRGSSFTITVPLTLTSMRVLFVRAGGHLLAISTGGIQKLLRIGSDDCHVMDGRTVLSLGESPLPVVPLAQLLDLPASVMQDSKIPAIVLNFAEVRAIVTVEELLSEQEVLVKNLGERIKRVKYISGSTILPDGQIALIINSAEVLRAALTWSQQNDLPTGSSAIASKVGKKHKLLLADDSITTRSIEKHLLESAGFDVTTCVDGAQAWQLMQERQFDAVVSDVEMPRMDGFALTRKIKASPRTMHIPVILVTALSSDRHKALGIAAGADAYLVKSEVERSDLAEVINQLI